MSVVVEGFGRFGMIGGGGMERAGSSGASVVRDGAGVLLALAVGSGWATVASFCTVALCVVVLLEGTATALVGALLVVAVAVGVVTFTVAVVGCVVTTLAGSTKLTRTGWSDGRVSAYAPPAPPSATPAATSTATVRPCTFTTALPCCWLSRPL